MRLRAGDCSERLIIWMSHVGDVALVMQVLDTLLHDLVCNSTAFLQQWTSNSEKLQAGVAARTAVTGKLISTQIPELKEALLQELQSLQQARELPEPRFRSPLPTYVQTL